jgi:hypothetical protein
MQPCDVIMVCIDLMKGTSTADEINLREYFIPELKTRSVLPLYTVPSAVSRLVRKSRYALTDGNAMLDAINYPVVCKSNADTKSRVAFSFIEHEV